MSGTFTVKKYLRDIPLPFCPGCGCFAVINCFLKAVHMLGYEDLSKFVFCSGIGCSAWIPSPHFLADSLHTTHGRSIAVATGVKVMRPDLNVVVFGGDGDIVGIGLSHAVHAARRNLDIVVVMVNNMIYGMTGGQVAPTTPFKVKTTTTPYGNFERPLDAAKLLSLAGASYAARWTTAHGEELTEALKTAIQTKGFAFVEVVSQCPTAYGRRAGFKDVKEMLQWFKNNSITIAEAEKIGEKDLTNKILVGEFVRRRMPTFTENLREIIREAMKNAEEN